MQTKDKLSVRRQCELLGITRSQVYYNPVPPCPEAVQEKEELMGRIDYWHTMNPAWGVRKLRKLLREEHYKVSRRRISRYMAEMGLCTVYPKANLSKWNFKQAIMPYLLRNKVISFPNQVWSIDITYIKMSHGHMYLTAIIDWHSRKLIGWKLSDTLDTQPILETVREAVERFGTPAILNSDQGSQFTSDEYKVLLKQLGIRQSMDGKSRWADNIMIERWFRSLKTELIYINEFCSPRALRSAVRAYVQQYNTIRPHQALEYETPDRVYNACFAASRAAYLDSAPLAC